MTGAYMTRNSMSERPMIIDRRMGQDALGFRAMPSSDGAMTSDSRSARPMNIDRRIGPAAHGFRAMPSTDAAIACDWPMAPAAAAMPSRHAAPMTPQRTPVPGAVVV